MDKITRRQFITRITSGIVGGSLGLPPLSLALQEDPDAESPVADFTNGRLLGILFDATRCIGCLACVKLCKEEHALPPDIEYRLSARSLTVVQNKNGYFMRRLCMHCLDPACVSVCPVGALQKRENGPVVWEESRCIGCRYCMMACPFRVPAYEWESRNPRVRKCDMCQHRLKEGREIACAWVCPLGATTFGERDDLVIEARRRIDSRPETYLPHIYGEREAGGTSTLFLLPIYADDSDLPEDLGDEPFPHLTWQIMRKIPYVIGTGAVVLGGVWWIINRRIELEELQRKLSEEETNKSDATDGEE